jgi:putative flippase GtrA
VIRALSSYGLASGFCFLLNNALLVAFDWVGLPLWLNLIICAAIVITVGYLLLAAFTFRQPPDLASFTRYALVMAPNVPIAFGLLWLADRWLPMIYAAPIVTTLMLLWNVTGSFWALRKPS